MELRNLSRRAAATDRVRRVAAALGAALAVSGLAGCADSPSAPSPAPGTAPRLEVVSPAVHARALLRDSPLLLPEEGSAVIGPAGGYIKLKVAGFELTVPAGAVSVPTQFTVTALPGAIVAYTFEPHGSTFAVPLKFEQTFKGTNWYKVAKDAVPEGGYFKDAAQLDPATGVVAVDEFLPAVADAKSGKLKFDVHHFSGYMVSWGRN